MITEEKLANGAVAVTCDSEEEAAEERARRLTAAASYGEANEVDEEALADADALAQEILRGAGCKTEKAPEAPLISSPSFNFEADDLLVEIDTARRATLTPHQRTVEDLSADFRRSVESGDLLGFLERTAARILDRPTLNLKHLLVRKVIASADHLTASAEELKRALEEASESE